MSTPKIHPAEDTVCPSCGGYAEHPDTCVDCRELHRMGAFGDPDAPGSDRGVRAPRDQATE